MEITSIVNSGWIPLIISIVLAAAISDMRKSGAINKDEDALLFSNLVSIGSIFLAVLLFIITLYATKGTSSICSSLQNATNQTKYNSCINVVGNGLNVLGTLEVLLIGVFFFFAVIFRARIYSNYENSSDWGKRIRGFFVWAFLLLPIMFGLFKILSFSIAIVSATSSSAITTTTQANIINNTNTHYFAIFNTSLTHLSVETKAIAQTQNNKTDGCGPSYLLNGYTANGYWYQIGLAYNYNCTNNNVSLANKGFKVVYEVYHGLNENITVGCQANGSYHACFEPFSNTVNDNDTIILNLTIIGKNIQILAYDINTSAEFIMNLSSNNATTFVQGSGPYYTGILTEWGCTVSTNFTQKSIYRIIYPQLNEVLYNANPYNGPDGSRCAGTVMLGKEYNQCLTSLTYNSNNIVVISGKGYC